MMSSIRRSTGARSSVKTMPFAGMRRMFPVASASATIGCSLGLLSAWARARNRSTVARADVDDLGVELDPVDWNRPVNCRELPSHRPAGQPDQRDAPRDPAGPEVGCQQDVVPVAVRVQAGGIVDRVDGRALIE